MRHGNISWDIMLGYQMRRAMGFFVVMWWGWRSEMIFGGSNKKTLWRIDLSDKKSDISSSDMGLNKNMDVHSIYWESSSLFPDTFLTWISGWISWPADCQHVCQTGLEPWKPQTLPSTGELSTPLKESHERILILGCRMIFGPTIASDCWPACLFWSTEIVELIWPFWETWYCAKKQELKNTGSKKTKG